MEKQDQHSDSQPRPIRHNAFIKLTSELIGRLALFALVLFAARVLGEAGFGLYNYALALGFVLAQLTDLGDQPVEIGMPVEMVTRKIRNDGDERGLIIYGYKFRPVMAH